MVVVALFLLVVDTYDGGVFFGVCMMGVGGVGGGGGVQVTVCTSVQ